MGVLDVFKRAAAPLSRRLGRTDGGEDLFDEDFQRKLEYLAMVSKRVFTGAMKAERRTKKTGAGVGAGARGSSRPSPSSPSPPP